MRPMIRLLALCTVLGAGGALSPAAEAESEAKAGLEPTVSLRFQDDGSSRPLPSGVRAEKVKFASKEIGLAGTIFIPKLGPGRRAPAVLLLSGSDQQRRGLVPIARAPLGAFNELAALLTGNGLVVLSYDTRCNGSSDCKEEATPLDYVSDAVAAFGYISRRPEVDASKVIVLGHDEGGTFAASLAAEPPAGAGKVVGVILIAVPGRTYGKVLREHAEKRLSVAGKSAAEISSYTAKFDLLTTSLSTGNVDFKAAKADDKDPLFSQFASNRQYFFHLFITDPLQVVRGIETPVLIVQGEKDAHIGKRDAQYLKESLDRQYNRDVTLEMLPEMDHWMRAQKGATVFRDEESTGPLDPALTAILNTWISKRVSRQVK